MNDSQPSVPYGYCHCGCGEKTALAAMTNRARGTERGKPVTFVHGHNRRGRLLSYIGNRYGRLVVTAEAGHSPGDGRRRLKCKCDCGGEAVVSASHLATGHTSSCGCLHKEMLRERPTTHGYSGSSTYNIWGAMLARCSNPNTESWRYYGGRGVTVCPRWTASFVNFLSDMGERPDGMTLDRINPDGNYEPGNCRWATWAQQAANKRTATLPAGEAREIHRAYHKGGVTQVELAAKHEVSQALISLVVGAKGRYAWLAR